MSAADERGDYAIFIAVIAVALLLLGGIAYDAPRLITARQHAAHTASQAAFVAAATVAAGGTIEQVRDAVQDHVASTPTPYRERLIVGPMACVGTQVEVTVLTTYQNRSVLGIFRGAQPIAATARAEAELIGPSGQAVSTAAVFECPLAVP
ncbi:hypothetical protein [Candidatus Poriferisodalis sp.]|uniref:hypothetical protein n=1 Tax=Candidatus Poriferisodalis sp. TaxID=3101277 RepID=UPI003B02B019